MAKQKILPQSLALAKPKATPVPTPKPVSYGPNQNYSPAKANYQSNTGVYGYVPSGGGQVLGASTYKAPGSYTPPQSSPSAPSAPVQQQQQQNTGNNQIPLQTIPEQQNIDFDALIRPGLELLSAYEPTLQSGYEKDVQGLNDWKSTQLQSNENDIKAKTAQIDRNRTSSTNYAENAANEARRQYAEIQQGLQSRYGGTTGTGAFASEISSRQSQQEFGRIRQGLSEAMQKLDDNQQQVQAVGEIARQTIENNVKDSIAQAKKQLDNDLMQIRQQRGELQARKAELAANAVQIYQNTVNNVKAQNAAVQQNYFLQQKQAEQQLELGRQKLTGILGSYGVEDYLKTGKPAESPVKPANQAQTTQSMGGGRLPDQKKLLEQYGMTGGFQY